MWIDAIINRLPLAYTEHPDEILALLNEVSSILHDLDTEQIAQRVVETSCRNLAELCHLRPPSPWIKGSMLLMLLTVHQLGSCKKIGKKRLDEHLIRSCS